MRISKQCFSSTQRDDVRQALHVDNTGHAYEECSSSVYSALAGKDKESVALPKLRELLPKIPVYLF